MLQWNNIKPAPYSRTHALTGSYYDILSIHPTKHCHHFYWSHTGFPKWGLTRFPKEWVIKCSSVWSWPRLPKRIRRRGKHKKGIRKVGVEAEGNASKTCDLPHSLVARWLQVLSTAVGRFECQRLLRQVVAKKAIKLRLRVLVGFER